MVRFLPLALVGISRGRAQFTLLFWDILFHPIDGVFEHAYQSAPLDLATDAFSIVRAALVDNRLVALEAGQGPALLKEADDRERDKKTWAVGMRWDFAAEDLAAIVEVRPLHR